MIADRRMRTELEPTLHFLKMLEGSYGKEAPRQVRELTMFLAAGVNFYWRLRRLPRSLLKRLMRLDVRITRLLGANGKEGVI